MTSAPAAMAPRKSIAIPSSTDVLVAAVVWLLDLGLGAALLGGPAAVAYSVLGCVPLAWRRHMPVAVFGLVGLLQTAGALALDGYRPFLGLLVALYSVAAQRELRLSIAALTLSLVTTTPIAVWQEASDNPEDPFWRVAFVVGLIQAVVCVGSWGLGRWTSRNRHSMERLEERRQKAAAEAVREERRRLAGELHDIVSHSVSVMVLQASGARRVLPTDAARADEALAHIEGVGKQAMGELRRLLGVLDTPHPTSEATNAEGRPQPRLADLPALLDGMRLTGLRVHLLEVGTPSPLDPSVELSAYRIIQEALTNSMKHAGQCAIATVKVQWDSEALMVEVTDDGGSSQEGENDLSTNHGILGLRERVRAVGGQLEAGPQDVGGFRVAAVLPLSGTPTPFTEPDLPRRDDTGGLGHGDPHSS
jgi:signal transduction histidine kinase